MFHVEPMSKAKKNKILEATDHLVSGESFSIHWDPTRHRAWTDVEHLETLDAYYNSLDYISHRSKPESLISLLYVLVREIMLNYKYALLKKHLQPKSRLLDLGCGTGAFLAFMKKRGFQVYGIESNPKARGICLKNNLEVWDTEKGLAPSSFDMISLWHVLEHLPEPEIYITAFKGFLKPQGLLFVAVPNFESHDSIHYKEDWAALDVPRHLWHFTPKGLIKMLNELGFDFVEKRALGFDVFYICYLSEKHKGRSLSLFRGVIKGALFSAKAFFTGKYSSWVYVFRKQVS